jgi:hypothetical protein
MSFATITICVASQRVFIAGSVYFIIDSVRKLLDIPSYAKSTNSGVPQFFSLSTLHFVRIKNVLCLRSFHDAYRILKL